ncbi:MAG: hypothetical protein MI673_04415 [Thiotrichales bacterium]|nr:hypothetical protein [Thiotrichales bacterium]
MNTIERKTLKTPVCSRLLYRIAVLAFPAIFSLGNAHADEGDDDLFWDALTGGKFDFSARYRFEHVDDDLAMDQANASTIRTTLGYTTGTFHGFGIRLMGQDVRDVFVDDFNDGTMRPNSKTRYAVVADPSETDFLEAYLSYNFPANTTLKLGRQIITVRKAPFHRYLGTVLWRQNWQNHDAFTVKNTWFKDTVIRYGYSWNINRIFTDESPVDGRANFDSDSHLFNIQHSGFEYVKLEAYAYLLDFDNSRANSVETYGIRMNGGYPLMDKIRLIYTAEFASQDDYGKNPLEVDENYYLGEIGASFQPGNLIDKLTLKVSYEVLEGNGTTSFRTPVATGHAFQGWADRFLTTPADGIEDLYLTAVVNAFGAKFIASYHMLESDNLNYDYGDELDLLISKTFKKHYTLGSKIAIYDSDTNANNLARGGSRAADVTKIWAWIQIKF